MNNWSRVHAHDVLSHEFTTRIALRCGCPASSFFNFVTVMIMEVVLRSCGNPDIGVCSNGKLFGLEFWPDVVLLIGDRPNDGLGMLGVHFYVRTVDWRCKTGFCQGRNLSLERKNWVVSLLVVCQMKPLRVFRSLGWHSTICGVCRCYQLNIGCTLYGQVSACMHLRNTYWGQLCEEIGCLNTVISVVLVGYGEWFS